MTGWLTCRLRRAWLRLRVWWWQYKMARAGFGWDFTAALTP